MTRKRAVCKSLSWQDLSQLLRQVLDFYGVDYRVIPLSCGDDPHCADAFHFKALKAELHLKCVHGTVYSPEVRVVVRANDYGVPVFDGVQLGGLSLKATFSTLCMDRYGIGLGGLDGSVRIYLLPESHEDSEEDA